MSNFEVKMPKLGESITEGTIVSLPVKLGDVVKEDQILFEVTTAKVNAEVPSAVEGKIVKLLYREGDTVDVGETVLIIDMDIDNAVVDESNSVALPVQVEKTEKEVQTPVSQPESAPQQSVINENNDETPTNIPAEEQRWYSPIVTKLAKEGGVSNQELEQIQGTGYLGRLSKKDLKTYIEQRGKQPEDKKLRPSEKPIQDLLKQNLI
ncbi:MAG: biotin/lipoyl-containing protein, partial [Paludibacteraceae bacterium]